MRALRSPKAVSDRLLRKDFVAMLVRSNVWNSCRGVCAAVAVLFALAGCGDDDVGGDGTALSDAGGAGTGTSADPATGAGADAGPGPANANASAGCMGGSL